MRTRGLGVGLVLDLRALATLAVGVAYHQQCGSASPTKRPLHHQLGDKAAPIAIGAHSLGDTHVNQAVLWHSLSQVQPGRSNRPYCTPANNKMDSGTAIGIWQAPCHVLSSGQALALFFNVDAIAKTIESFELLISIDD